MTSFVLETTAKTRTIDHGWCSGTLYDLPEKFYLDTDETCWVTVEKIHQKLLIKDVDHFDRLFAMHPETRGKALLHKEVENKRWHQSFLNTPKYNGDSKKSYMFCGEEDTNKETLPPEFEPFFKYINTFKGWAINGLPIGTVYTYNQVVANWYDSDDFIAFHSDYYENMAKNSDVAILSFNRTAVGGSLTNEPPTAVRNFTIKPIKRFCQNFKYDSVEIPLTDGIEIHMGGKTQEYFKHGVKKCVGAPKRISFTFRNYN